MLNLLRSFILVAVVLVFASSCTGRPDLNSTGGGSSKVSETESYENIKAVIETRFGDIELKFYPEVAPGHVKNFVDLARKGFYDGTIFHRVIPGFMIQGGDPNTKGDKVYTYGQGGPGYSIPAEFSELKHTRGILSMARSQDPDSAGSQFFVMVKDYPSLDGLYSVFGEVTSGIEVADRIVSVGRDGRDMPYDRVEMKVRIIEVAPEGEAPAGE